LRGREHSGSSFQSFNNYAVAVNNTGVVVGCSAGNAFLVHSGQISQVGPDGFSMRGINDAGTMAGYLDSHTYLLSSGGTLTQLPDLSPNGGGGNTPSSHAFGINNGNQIIGTSNNSQEFPHAVIWSDGTLTDLGRSAASRASVRRSTTSARPSAIRPPPAGPTTRSSTAAAT
jgi:probable HAF family extracellular repeat protein